MQKILLITAILFLLFITGCLNNDYNYFSNEDIEIVQKKEIIEVYSRRNFSGIEVSFNTKVNEKTTAAGNELIKIQTYKNGRSYIAITKNGSDIQEGTLLFSIRENIGDLKNLNIETLTIDINRSNSYLKTAVNEGITVIDKTIPIESNGYFFVRGKAITNLCGSKIVINYDTNFLEIDQTKGNNGVDFLNQFENKGIHIVNNLSGKIEIYSAFENSGINITEENLFRVNITTKTNEGQTNLICEGELRDEAENLISKNFYDGVLNVGSKNSEPLLLGDFDSSDRVGLIDLMRFSNRYRTEIGDDSYEELYDISPAEDLYGEDWAGIYDTCYPDGEINLEDFIIFGCNFGKETPITNNPPEINIENQTVNEGEVLSLNLDNYSNDIDGDVLSYNLISGVGVITNNTYSYSPNFTDEGEKTITIQVDDGKGGTSQCSFLIQVIGVNGPPTIDIPDQNITEGDSVSLNLNEYSSDPDGDTLTYILLEGIGAVESNTYTYNSDYNSSGEYSVTIGVEDPSGAADSTIFAIVVNDNTGASNNPGALELDGTNDYVDLNYEESLSNNSDFTVELWTKGNFNDYIYLISQAHTLSGYSSDWFMGNYFGKIVWFRGTSFGDIESINDNQWHHLALVWDKDLERATLYIDGVFDSQAAVSGYSGVGSVKVGARADSLEDQRFQGRVDEVRIWNKEKTETEIQNDMNLKLNGTENGLVGYWRFDETEGSVAEDITGNNNATVINSTWIPGAIDLQVAPIIYNLGSTYYGTSILRNPNNNEYIVNGWSFFAAVNENGEIIWQNNHGIRGDDVILSSDGNYLICHNDDPVSLLKKDTSGNQLWINTFGGRGAGGLCQSQDGSIYITGRTDSMIPNAAAMYLVKTDSSGNKIWEKAYADNEYNYGHGIISTSDGNLLVVGSSDDEDLYNRKIFLWKLNTDGGIIWKKGFCGGEDYGYDVLEDSLGNYVLTGQERAGDNYYMFVAKVTPDGTTLWEKRVGSCRGYSIYECSNGDYLLVGGTSGLAQVARINTDGELIWLRNIHIEIGFYSGDVLEKPDGSIFVFGGEGAALLIEIPGNN